jgi:hypothetical protein
MLPRRRLERLSALDPSYSTGELGVGGGGVRTYGSALCSVAIVNADVEELVVLRDYTWYSKAGRQAGRLERHMEDGGAGCGVVSDSRRAGIYPVPALRPRAPRRYRSASVPTMAQSTSAVRAAQLPGACLMERRDGESIELSTASWRGLH